MRKQGDGHRMKMKQGAEVKCNKLNQSIYLKTQCFSNIIVWFMIKFASKK